jgi:predicted transcriptional regulator YdeE
MQHVTRSAMRVVGHEARTSNPREQDPATARIPGLWEQLPVVMETVPEMTGRVCAVYTDYASDFLGDYTIVVGVEVPDYVEAPDGMVLIEAPEAVCSVFRAASSKPPAVVEAWREVWDAFPSGSNGRAYTTDVEVHVDGGTEIFVAVGP